MIGLEGDLEPRLEVVGPDGRTVSGTVAGGESRVELPLASGGGDRIQAGGESRAELPPEGGGRAQIRGRSVAAGSFEPRLKAADPRLKAVGPGSRATLSTAGAGGNRAAPSLAGAGRYLIRVRSVGDRTAGSFRLSVEPKKMYPVHLPLCGGQVLRPGQPISDELRRGVCRYPFDGEAGDFVTLRMDALAGGIDPVVVLFDPENQEEAYDDDGGGDGNSLIEGHRLLRTGRYEVRAESYGAPEGEFSLGLEYLAGDGSP